MLTGLVQDRDSAIHLFSVRVCSTVYIFLKGPRTGDEILYVDSNKDHAAKQDI